MTSDINISHTFIDSSITDYRDIVSSVADSAKERGIVLLLGAGVSHAQPSCLPLADDLSKPLINLLLHSMRPKAIGCVHGSPDQRKAFDAIRSSRLERLLDVFHQVHGEEALDYLKVLNGRAWNDSHEFVAALAAEDLITQCITLNFDLLIEHAIADKGFGSMTYCPLTQTRFTSGSGAPCITITKPHGSFVMDANSSDPYALLSATLSQVGKKPDPRNIQALLSAVSDCNLLIVAGYSDNDWDIFPILEHYLDPPRRVIWIQYASNSDIQARGVPSAIADIKSSVIPWLNRAFDQANACLLLGDPKVFFANVLDSMQITLDRCSAPPVQPKAPEAHPLVSLETSARDPRHIKNVLCAAMLIQHTGEFSLRLLRWLALHPIVAKTPSLSWRVEYLRAHSQHTISNLPAAIRHTRRAIKSKRQSDNPADSCCSSELLWLGYEYFCMLKRINHLNPLRVLSIPFYLFRGNTLLRQAVESAPVSLAAQITALAEYYKADLFHAWANMFMLFGSNASFLYRPLFRVALRRYDTIAESSQLMDWEYYWMRHLEAKLLLDIDVDAEEVQSRLDLIENSNRLINENVQIGNTFAYRALYLFVTTGNTSRALQLLDEAERIWSESGKSIQAGHRRTILFRRFMGQMSIRDAFVAFMSSS